VELQWFDTIEQASPAWDHTHLQLGRGSARVRVTAAHAPRMELAVVSRSPGVLKNPQATFELCVDRDRLGEAAIDPWGQPIHESVHGPYLRFLDDASRRSSTRS
jgi:hypothetical protein